MSIKIDDSLIKQLHEAITNHQRFVIIPHKNPDGDALGASLGLCKMLADMGKAATVVSPNSMPVFLNWLEGSSNIIDFEKSKEKAIEAFATAEVIFCLDFNDISRLGELKTVIENFSGFKVLVDHHPNPNLFCDITISDTIACSTCELLYIALRDAGFSNKIDKTIGEAFFSGIMSDTGNFSYNSSSPDTYRVVADLLEKGIDKDAVHSKVYHSYSSLRWKLLGYCLYHKMQVLEEYKTAYITITKRELYRFNFQSGDSEGFVNFPLMIKGIVFTALFIENDGFVKASFRSKGNFPANKFSATHFSGGGHTNAAGGESKLSLRNTEEKFISLLPEYRDLLLNSNELE